MGKFIKTFVLILYFCLFLNWVWAQGPKKEIIVIYGIGGKGDKSFNNSLFTGVENLRKNLNVNITEVEPLNQFDALNQYEKYARLNKGLIVSLGSENKVAFEQVAIKYPNSELAFIDVPIQGNNVANFTFREQEGSYLVGYLAAKFSKTKKIGFVGGMNIPPLQRFYKGYEQGAKEAYAAIEVFKNFIGNNSNAWLNPSAAKLLARKQYAKGADVLYAVAGGSNLGVFEAATETKQYAIGVDINQNGFAPGFILTSMVKRIDNVLFMLCNNYINNKFKPGTFEMGLKEGGLDIVIDENSTKILRKELIEEINSIKEKIIKGEIKIN